MPGPPSAKQRALVLGGYGFIGAACARALRAAGYHVTGLGRSHTAARQSGAADDWIICDIATASPRDWAGHLAGFDVVVNASGALQDGLHDDLAALHIQAVSHMLGALADTTNLFIQISAVGALPDASTEFLRTKAQGDARVQQHSGKWIILRPALVIGAQAYGGTALLRAAAALPLVRPDVLGDSPIQTVHVHDVARAVVACANGGIPPGTTADLTEASAQTLRSTITAFRQWLGYPDWRRAAPIPAGLLWPVTKVADGLGWLGWRSPLRTTAIASLADGITGDPTAWQKAGGAPCRPLSETLASLPAHAQERSFARLYLPLPLAVATLALFWLASGLIGIWQFEAAKAILTDRGMTPGLATFAVAAGAIADIALGIGVMIRRWTKWACLGMVAVAGGYLTASLFTAPDLWADPLGPMVKVIPSITLALMVAALIEDR